jgi:hypothetical protein
MSSGNQSFGIGVKTLVIVTLLAFNQAKYNSCDQRLTQKIITSVLLLLIKDDLL